MQALLFRSKGIGSLLLASVAAQAVDLHGHLGVYLWVYEQDLAARKYYEGLGAVALWTDLEATGYPADRVKVITAPTLVVRGDTDFLFSLSKASVLRATLPTASFLNVPFAGHEVHKDSPRLFLAGIKDFLAGPRTPIAEG